MKKRKFINNIIIFVAIIAIFLGGLFYYKLNKLQDGVISKKDKKTIIKEKNNLISKISELYMFPEGEIPTIATVSDPQVLKDQGFFAQSLVGDKVFIFTKAGKAVLYRPDLGRIVDIVSVKNSSPTGGVPTTSQSSSTSNTSADILNIKENAN